MKVRLTNGMVIEGTPTQVAEAMKKMGYSDLSGYYNSSTKGLILIQEMHSLHIRNAIIKEFGKWLNDTLRNTTNAKDFLDLLEKGPNSATILALVKEMHSRKHRDKW